MRIAALVLAGGLAFGPVLLPAPDAQAAGCVHRGKHHRAEHGGLEDDRFHMMHGEPVTCDDKDDDHHEREARDRHHAEGDHPHEGRHHDDEHHEHHEPHPIKEHEPHLPGHKSHHRHF